MVDSTSARVHRAELGSSEPAFAGGATVRPAARTAAGPGSSARAADDRLPGSALRFTVSVLILVTLSRIHLHLGLGQLRVALLLALAAGLVAFFQPRLARWGNLTKAWPPRTVFALAILACFSAVFGISLGGSAQYILGDFSKVLILFVLVIIAFRCVADLRLFMWAYVISCGILAYYALIVFEPYRTRGSAAARLGGLYSFDANDIGCILMSGLPMALLLFQTSKAMGKAISSLIMVGIGATVALSGSRGTFLGLVLVVGGLLLFLPKISVIKRVGAVMTVVLALAIMAPAGYWRQMATILEPTDDYNWTSYYGRKATAERAIGYMLRYPVFGIGIGNFSRAEGTISERAVSFVDTQSGLANRWRASHNSFLQAGSELGIPGLVLWSSLIFGIALGMHRLRRRLPQQWLSGTPPERFLYLCTVYIPIMMLGFASTSFFVSFAWLDPLYLLVAFAAGVYLLSDARLRNPQGGGLRPRRTSSGSARAPNPGYRLRAHHPPPSIVTRRL